LYLSAGTPYGIEVNGLRAVELLGTDRFRHFYASLRCAIGIADDPIAVMSRCCG
jgi:hypothetical protein